MKQMVLIFLGFFMACGSSPTVQVRLRAADNSPQANPFAVVQSEMDAGLSRGLYFELYEMNDCPTTIQDVVPGQGPVLSQPNQNELGASPASSSFNIDISNLNKNKPYFLKVSAINTGTIPQATHEGFADCPIYASDAGKQFVTLCFSSIGVTPQCSTATDFGSCRKPNNCQ